MSDLCKFYCTNFKFRDLGNGIIGRICQFVHVSFLKMERHKYHTLFHTLCNHHPCLDLSSSRGYFYLASILKTKVFSIRRVDFKKFDRTNQGRVYEPYRSIVLENRYIRLTILPERGNVCSLIYKVTGHEQFFIPTTAHALGSPNKLGWWFVLGGVEYTLPDEEHGSTWAAEWDWSITENSETKKTVQMSVRETESGLEERLSISVYADKTYYEAELEIRNPTAWATRFQHWINPMWAPGGQGQLTPATEFRKQRQHRFSSTMK